MIIKVRRLSMRYRRSLSKVLVNAAALEGQQLSRVEVEFRDGLPQDDYEQAQIESMRTTSGNTSRKSSIKRLDGVTDTEADEEIERIDEDASATTPSFGTQPINPSVATGAQAALTLDPTVTTDEGGEEVGEE